MSELVTSGVQNEKTPIAAGLQAGLIAGVAGLAVGGTVGIVKSKAPLVLWTLVSSAQCALLGGTYWGLRTALLQQVPSNERKPSTRLVASTMSGCLSFVLVGAVTRGRQNVVPGAVMGSLFGLGGQGIYNVLDRRHTAVVLQDKPRKTLWQRFTEAKWSPIWKLSDEDYLKLLNEKRLRLDTEIAMLDDEIKELEEQEELRSQISSLQAQQTPKR